MEILNELEEFENKQIIYNDMKWARVRESLLIRNYIYLIIY